MSKLDTFTHAYLVCALWSSSDEAGTPLDQNYDVDDIGDEFKKQAIEDCADFQQANAADLAAAYEHYGDGSGEYAPEARAGHDFWLTRCGHGAGFWDRGMGALGDRLTSAAKIYGSVDLMPHDMTEPPALVPDLETGHTIRTQCQRGRISYRPDWSLAQPWATYVDGIAGQHLTTAHEAIAYFAKRGMTIIIESEKYNVQ